MLKHTVLMQCFKTIFVLCYHGSGCRVALKEERSTSFEYICYATARNASSDPFIRCLHYSEKTSSWFLRLLGDHHCIWTVYHSYWCTVTSSVALHHSAVRAAELFCLMQISFRVAYN